MLLTQWLQQADFDVWPKLSKPWWSGASYGWQEVMHPLSGYDRFKSEDGFFVTPLATRDAAGVPWMYLKATRDDRPPTDNELAKLVATYAKKGAPTRLFLVSLPPPPPGATKWVQNRRAVLVRSDGLDGPFVDAEMDPNQVSLPVMTAQKVVSPPAPGQALSFLSPLEQEAMKLFAQNEAKKLQLQRDAEAEQQAVIMTLFNSADGIARELALKVYSDTLHDLLSKGMAEMYGVPIPAGQPIPTQQVPQQMPPQAFQTQQQVMEQPPPQMVYQPPMVYQPQAQALQTQPADLDLQAQAFQAMAAQAPMMQPAPPNGTGAPGGGETNMGWSGPRTNA